MEFNAALKVSSMLPNGAAALADLGLERTFAAVAFFAAAAFASASAFAFASDSAVRRDCSLARVAGFSQIAFSYASASVLAVPDFNKAAMSVATSSKYTFFGSAAKESISFCNVARTVAASCCSRADVLDF